MKPIERLFKNVIIYVDSLATQKLNYDQKYEFMYSSNLITNDESIIISIYDNSGTDIGYIELDYNSDNVVKLTDELVILFTECNYDPKKLVNKIIDKYKDVIIKKYTP